MKLQQKKRAQRLRRHRGVRRRISGTAARPRLCVHRSLAHIQCQVIDDEAGRTLAAASSNEPVMKGELPHGGNVLAAQKIGQLIGARARQKGIVAVVFDRGGYRYHGRVKALAEAARQAGLKF